MRVAPYAEAVYNGRTDMNRSSLDLFDLTCTVALVTGSSRGLGLTIARGLAGAGALPVLNGRNTDSLDRAVADLGSEGLRAERIASAASSFLNGHIIYVDGRMLAAL